MITTINEYKKYIKESMNDYDSRLETFLNKFPDNATSWTQATEETREVVRALRLFYNDTILNVLEGEPGYIEGLNFRSFNTPAEFNTKAKAEIRRLWSLIPEDKKDEAFSEIDNFVL